VEGVGHKLYMDRSFSSQIDMMTYAQALSNPMELLDRIFKECWMTMGMRNKV
jgi:hypothetical protein